VADTKPEEPTDRWYASLEGAPIHGADLRRIDALIAAGVISESQRGDAEWLFSALSTAGTSDGGDADTRLVREAVKLAAKGLPPEAEKHRKRVAVVRALEGAWKPGWAGTAWLLRRIDPAFSGITKKTWDAHTKGERS
jgi:hypothetical protein